VVAFFGLAFGAIYYYGKKSGDGTVVLTFDGPYVTLRTGSIYGSDDPDPESDEDSEISEDDSELEDDDDDSDIELSPRTLSRLPINGGGKIYAVSLDEETPDDEDKVVDRPSQYCPALQVDDEDDELFQLATPISDDDDDFEWDENANYDAEMDW
jgi:hypothetical protein